MKLFEEREAKQRKPYVKPHLGVVSLVPKQTVLGTCFSPSDLNGRDAGTCSDPQTLCMTETGL